MPIDGLSTTFAALADPTRRAILARLAAGEATVGELAQPFQMTLPAVTKHLKVLEGAGLIARGRAAQWRPCSLRAAPLKDATNWLETYRQHWEQRLDRLEAYLQTLQAQQGRRDSVDETVDSQRVANEPVTRLDKPLRRGRRSPVKVSGK